MGQPQGRQSGLRPQTYSAPLSFVGSSRRILAWLGLGMRDAPTERGWALARKAALWLAAALLITVAWAAIVLWYSIAYTVFGVFTIPFRLIRRSQRKQNAIAKAQLAVLEKMRDRRPV